MSTAGSDFNTILGLFTGSALDALTLVASDDDSGGGGTSFLTFAAIAGVTYYIMVDGFGGASGNIQIAISAPAQTLLVTPVTNIAASGNNGGPFSPSSFQYQLSASSGSIGYSISGLPAWLDVSETSGTLTTSPTALTFTVNSTANGLAAGSYHATIGFTNTTNGQGDQSRAATLTVSAGGGGGSDLSETYVSARSGTDTGLCPITAPCASLNYALSVTGAGGRVTILDDGVFGPIVLTQPVTIVGSPANAAQIIADPSALVGCVGALPSGCGLPNNGFAVEIAAGVNDSVKITHVLMGAGSSGGVGALKFTSGGQIQLSQNIYRGNDTQTGPIVALYPNNPGTTQAQVYFSNSDVAFSANGGAVEVKPSGDTSLKLHFNHMAVHNTSFGIRTDGSALLSPGDVVATFISESEFFSFNFAAVNAFSTLGTGTVNAAFDATRILNAGVALKANGPQSTVILTNNTVSGNGVGVLVQNGAQVYTPANNTICGNGTDLSGALSSTPLR